VNRCLLIPVLAALLLPDAARAQDEPPKPRTVPAVRGRLPDPLPLKFVGPPTEAAITPLDLATRLYKFADDSMMGRLTGTPWNDKGTDYIEREVRRLGLVPAGENGGYFQQAIVTRELADGASLGVGGQQFTPWTDFAPRFQGPGERPFAGTVTIYGGTYGDTATYLPPADVVGKTVVMRVGNGADGKPDFNIINRFQLTNRYRGAAAIAVGYIDYAAPGYVDAAYRQAGPQAKSLPGTPAPPLPSYFYISRRVAQAIFGVDPDSLKTGMTGKAFDGAYRFEERPAPGRNVIAVLPGSDPKLRGQYVAIGAHNDHIGFNNEPADHDSVKAFMRIAAPQGADNGPPQPTAADLARIASMTDSLRKIHGPRTDSIYNGADDDGSGSMSLLEIAEAFASAPNRPRRSIVFIWHVGEELGLFGSQYFTDNPTLPRDSIIAALNIDMIGRGRSEDITGTTKDGTLLRGDDNGYVQLVGARRLSTQLGNLVEEVNTAEQLGIRFDYAMDANGHPQNIYCRSDHYEYAKYGIPVVFFTTGGHADYHQVTDEPQYINYTNMTRVAKLVQQSAIKVANLADRVVVDKPKPDPRGTCVQ
jgi:hypothetical protein